MDTKKAVKIISALSNETRLKVAKLLVKHGKSGKPAGYIGEKLGVPHNTLSFHLMHLHVAGLVTSRKEGRSVIYTIDVGTVQELASFLLENCCVEEEGTPSECAPIASPRRKAAAAAAKKPRGKPVCC
jgi:ArsR family transcriptional regulator, arsenate/arsenite/antimonite-responsive transcriptional repressor